MNFKKIENIKLVSMLIMTFGIYFLFLYEESSYILHRELYQISIVFNRSVASYSLTFGILFIIFGILLYLFSYLYQRGLK